MFSVKVVVFWQMQLYSGISVCVRTNWLYSGKSGGIQKKSSRIRVSWLYSCKVVVFGQKLLYSGESGCIWSNKVVFVQSGCNRAYVVVFGKKWL